MAAYLHKSFLFRQSVTKKRKRYMAAECKVSMKLLIHTKEKRVLFAEAGKNCVDFLFQLLSLPVATIIRLLQLRGMVGSLPNLYKSLQSLNSSYIQPNRHRDTFLKPVAPVSSFPVPLLAIDNAVVAKKFYRCSSHSHCGYASDDSRAVCVGCNRPMTTKVQYVPPPAVQDGGGGLVKGLVTYMVMDDLVVKPICTISILNLLKKFKVKDVGTLEEKVVSLGMNEAVKLLRSSLKSKKVLTDVFCS